MPILATPVYAAVVTALYLFLAFLVVRQRQRDRVAWGDGGQGRLHQLVRAHANLAEYAPLGLLLVLLAEMQGAPGWVLHLAGLSLLAGRFLHAVGFVARPDDLRLRVAGMILTFQALATGALGALYATFSG